MTTTITDLHIMCDILRVHLRHHTGGPLGWYSSSLRTISTRRGLAIWDYKSTLAHEIGHAYYNDTHTDCSSIGTHQERRADRFAAKLLINEADLRTAAEWHGNDLHAIAIDLEVTPDLLEVFLTTHTERTLTA